MTAKASTRSAAGYAVARVASKKPRPTAIGRSRKYHKSAPDPSRMVA